MKGVWLGFRLRGSGFGVRGSEFGVQDSVFRVYVYIGSIGQPDRWWHNGLPERKSFIDNLLDRIHYIIEMIKWTGLAPWEF